jgi:hypothetical protein
MKIAPPCGKMPLLAVALLFLSACQPKVPQYADLNLSQGELNWSRFTVLSKQNAESFAPFNAVLTVRYQTPDKSYRFDAYFWSNFAPATPYPVRLDILGAFGAAKAKIFEDQHTFLLYDPESNSAYTASNSPRAMLKAGIPLPMRLGELAALFNGHYQDFFLPGQNAARPELTSVNDRLESAYYIASGPLKGELAINSRGQPVSWTAHRKQDQSNIGWRFEFDYLSGVDAWTLPGPRRIRVAHPEGYSVAIQIRTLQRREKPFTPEQLDLILPATATIKTAYPDSR